MGFKELHRQKRDLFYLSDPGGIDAKAIDIVTVNRIVFSLEIKNLQGSLPEGSVIFYLKNVLYYGRIHLRKLNLSFNGFNARKCLAFNIFQHGSAAGRHIAHFIRQSELAEGRTG